MANIEQSIDVEVPISTAYNQWTQFEEFPKFMEGVDEIRQLDGDTTRIMVQMDWAPEGIKEKLGSSLGFDQRRIEGDLKRFKELIESQGTESGAYRETVPRDG